MSTELVVDLEAIAENVRIFRAHTDIPLMAVVKSDGYGHGAVEVARTALAHGAEWLAVTYIDEALDLRATNVGAPILTFVLQPAEDPTPALLANIDLTVSSHSQLTEIATSAERLGRTANIHLKVDTGLHRSGAPYELWPALVEAAELLERRGLVHVRGIWSALAHLDTPTHATTARQLDTFDLAIRQAEKSGLTNRIAHIANSAAGLANPRSRHDLIRVGSALYGIEPVRGRNYGFRPAMTLRSRVVMTRPVGEGEGVSYGHRYITNSPGNLALLHLGYADGLPRAASGSAQVSIAGARKPVAGLMAMNSCIIDLGQTAAAPGDEVTVFGPGTNGEPTIADWAAWSKTNPQELMTRVGPAVPRRHISALEPTGTGRLRVAVLFGGPGGEGEISCASAAPIVTHLDRTRYQVQPVRINQARNWIPGPTDWPAGPCTPTALLAATPNPTPHTKNPHLSALTAIADADVVIPALHGPFGEDGTVQAVLDTLGVHYVGSGTAASALGMDKDVTKRVLSTCGLKVADWAVLCHDEDHLPEPDRARLDLPLYVKPARSGSSLGVSKVSTLDELDAAIAEARTEDAKVLVEQGVIGREVDIAVLQHPDGRIVASPPAEIVLNKTRRDFLDYTAKYEDTQATEILLPAPLDPDLTAELQRQAVHAFRILGCQGLARVDFLLRDGIEPVFNEINTFPGFSASSLYARMWAAAGIPLPELLDVLIATALTRVSA